MADTVPKIRLNNGLEIPVLGLGTRKSKPGEVKEAVEDAIDIGYRHFDCAHVYQNENEVGAGLKNKIKSGVVKREDLWITSKLWNTFHLPHLVEPALKITLENLQLDYVDMYLIHWPQAYKEGKDLFPVDENGKTQYSDAAFTDTWKAMEDCVKKGMARSIGLSNFNSQQLEKVLRVCTIKPVTNQVECHPYLNQSKLSEFCRNCDIVISAYSPLGSNGEGAKPGDVQLLEDLKLKEVADKYGKTPAQILLRYQIQRNHIVIPKTIAKSKLEENFDIFDFEISARDMNYVDTLDCNGRLYHLDWVKDHKDYPFSIEF